MDKLLLVLLLSLASLAAADEIYQNSSHICERCICREDPDEFFLDCTGQHFEHVLANWPPHNKTLVATFSYNNMTTLEILPDTEQKAKLVLDHCNIRYVDPGVFKGVKNVEFIDMSYNLLTTEEIDGEDFKGPYNNSVFYPIPVKHLNLAYNQIHSLPRKFFENMPDLKELNLEGNDFYVLDQNTQMALSSLSKLKRLNLADNELTELVGHAVKGLDNLVELNLASNRLDFVPETLDYLKNLQSLNISDNYIFEIRDDSFLGGMNDHLDFIGLYITNTSITLLDYTLLSWSNLRVLELKDNTLECDCDLYKISRDLHPDITRTRDGPRCIDPRTDASVQMYALEEDICDLEIRKPGIYHAARHFETLRVILITLTTMFTITTLVAVTIACLRYRKGSAYRNYNFTTQVQYNPLQTQYRI
ncbi:hypothetical protein NQ318_019198 [Aromia moschata]|uniref:Uncharacterized protein n=1 Tax=Aromia moschata TaxID=1265417 RepID=A0AAV8YTF6_9CUCU|nr:hypothetical protein NQ318_019198 [Aromia moschata]